MSNPRFNPTLLSQYATALTFDRLNVNSIDDATLATALAAEVMIEKINGSYMYEISHDELVKLEKDEIKPEQGLLPVYIEPRFFTYAFLGEGGVTTFSMMNEQDIFTVNNLTLTELKKRKTQIFAILLERNHIKPEDVQPINLTPEQAKDYYTVSKKLGILQAFKERSSQKTNEYLNGAEFKKHFSTVKENISQPISLQDEFEIANTGLLQLYGDIIDGNTLTVAKQEIELKNQHKIFNALEAKVRADAAQNELLNQIILDKGFINRYIALMKHRASMNRTLAPKKRLALSKEAQKILETSLELIHQQAGLEKSIPFSVIDINEMYHLIGVALKEQAIISESLLFIDNSEFSKAFLEKALNTLNRALVGWEASEKITGNINPIKYITMQSIAEVLRLLGRTEEAPTLILETIELQKVFYQTENNTDIAKSFHFLGEIYEDRNNLPDSLTAFNKSLTIKKEIKSPMIPMTENAIFRVETKLRTTEYLIDNLPQTPVFDWNNHHTFKDYSMAVNSTEIILRVLMARSNELNQNQKNLLADRCLQLGSYYNHITRTPYQALPFNQFAATNFSNPEQKAWANNHLAFCYQQSLSAANEDAKVEMETNQKVSEGTAYEIQQSNKIGSEYYMQIIQTYENKTSNIEEVKILAFAYCIKALFEFEMNEVKQSVDTYAKAIYLYDINGINDHQRNRAANRYAQFLIKLIKLSGGQPENHPNPLAILEPIEEYWKNNDDATGNYSPRFYHNFSDYLIDLYQAAKDEDKDIAKLEKAFALYKKAEEKLTSLKELGYAKDMGIKATLTQDMLSRAKQTSPRLSLLSGGSVTIPEMKLEETAGMKSTVM